MEYATAKERIGEAVQNIARFEPYMRNAVDPYALIRICINLGVLDQCVAALRGQDKYAADVAVADRELSPWRPWAEAFDRILNHGTIGQRHEAWRKCELLVETQVQSGRLGVLASTEWSWLLEYVDHRRNMIPPRAYPVTPAPSTVVRRRRIGKRPKTTR
jgi:hypothetical protein